jgi:disulfide bond formation protein DsbB
MTTNAGDLLGELNTIKGPSCTDTALRVLGLSFAGWNVIAGILLAAFAFVGVRKAAS